MTIEDLVNKSDIMPGAYLYELWKYYEKVRVILASDLTKFRESGACRTIADLNCTHRSTSQIPRWLEDYIESIGKTPNLFDPVELSIAMTRHAREWAYNGEICVCGYIPSQTIRNFWEALASVVHGSFEKVCMVDVQSHRATQNAKHFTGRVSFIPRAGSRGPSSPNR
jgi:hypothetical protein